MTPDELEIIKARWNENNRYVMIEMATWKVFEKAQKDVGYLLSRLEAAERAARYSAKMSGKYKIHCPHPLHEERQTRDKMPCPECGDTSYIPKG